MKPQHIKSIPIDQIRVNNPRSRNRVTFRGIVNNIGAVGLKKPVTVFQREMEADGTQYDLVCGQGRLEAITKLGGVTVPAIVTDASLKDRYLMSLIENIARKRPAHIELVREIQSLQKRGCTEKMVAEKLGMDPKYVGGIIRLFRRGEEGLVASVEAGSIPLGVAVKIATGTGEEVQRALSDAYENGDLRGEKLRLVQRLISRRAARERAASGAKTSKPQLSSKDLAKEYERHTVRQRTLVLRAANVNERLTILCQSIKQLLSDDAFVALLRAEALDKIPEQLAARIL